MNTSVTGMQEFTQSMHNKSYNNFKLLKQPKEGSLSCKYTKFLIATNIENGSTLENSGYTIVIFIS